MDNSPLIDHIQHSTDQFTIREARVSGFITNSKEWNLSMLNNLMKKINNKIKAIPIPLTKVKIS